MTDVLDTDVGVDSRHGEERGAERRTGGAAVRKMSNDELAQLVERAVADDRAFFAGHPHRRFRARRAFEVELEDFARKLGLEREAPPRWSWHVCVTCDLARIPFIAVVNDPGEVGEHEARRIFKSVSNGKWREFFRDAWRLAPIVASAASRGRWRA